ncbi:MAG: glycosyltransferase family 2 protein [Phycisphaerae bacterium]|nr:glycosyltransferase family 2 protein [Phycisphaerae bacterium]
MAAPTVSVVIPTYKHREYVAQAVSSALEQAGVSLEVIVVNDGSPDNTVQVLEPFTQSGRIRYIEQANAGQAAARNRGISAATGEFVALLDDDDLWPADRLAWQVERLAADPAAVMVFGDFEKFGDVTTHRGPTAAPGVRTFDDFARGCLLVSPGQASFRRSSLIRVGMLDTDLKGTDDWDLYLRLARQGKILYENRLALRYRVHSSNASRHFWQMYINVRKVVDKNLPVRTSDATLRSAAMAFAREYGSYMGIQRVIVLRRERRFIPMLAALARTIWIRPALLNPTAVWRRARYVLKRSAPMEVHS